MFISVNPSYLCNFRCSFCYLTKDQLADTKKIELDQLMGLLYELKHAKPEEEFIFDLYGGEISLLPDDYVDSLLSILSLFSGEPIRITTNLSRIPEYFYEDRVQLAVSYDMNARQDHFETYANMQTFGKTKQYDILMLASERLLDWHPMDIMSELDCLQGLRSVEVKPYSSNQANQRDVDFTDFESFVGEFILSYDRTGSHGFELQNKNLLQSVLRSERSAFSDDHIYITPAGRFAVLEFDSQNREYFLEIEGWQGYLDWTDLEKRRVTDNVFCSRCEYFGRCLSEHLREVKPEDKSCSGFKGLITWYEQIQKDK